MELNAKTRWTVRLAQNNLAYFLHQTSGAFSRSGKFTLGDLFCGSWLGKIDKDRWKKSLNFPGIKILAKKSGGKEPVWRDDQIVFSIFGHFQQRKFAQWHTNFPKTKITLNILPNIFKYLPKWGEFRQILSHCSPAIVIVCQPFRCGGNQHDVRSIL